MGVGRRRIASKRSSKPRRFIAPVSSSVTAACRSWDSNFSCWFRRRRMSSARDTTLRTHSEGRAGPPTLRIWIPPMAFPFRSRTTKHHGSLRSSSVRGGRSPNSIEMAISASRNCDRNIAVVGLDHLRRLEPPRQVDGTPLRDGIARRRAGHR